MQSWILHQWLKTLDSACGPGLWVLWTTLEASDKDGAEQRRDWMFLLEAWLRRRASVGPGGFLLSHDWHRWFSPLGGCRCGWWGCGGCWRVSGVDSLSGHPSCPVTPKFTPPLPYPPTPQGISRLFWRGPRGPFHHYTHDSLMQQAPGRCMGKGGGRRRGEVKPTSL